MQNFDTVLNSSEDRESDRESLVEMPQELDHR